jgi:aryl-alcohol dehydrogenase-like predicted oxidoreductase
MPLPGIERFVLGGGNFGGIGSAPELFGQGENEEAGFELLEAGWELGIRAVDTADAYGGGRSERTIGRWLRQTGKRPRLTTKTFNPMDAGHDHGLSRERIRRQIESSLERLGVDSVDRYLAHDRDPETPIAETIAAFEELVADGRVRAWGVSNFTAAQLRETLALGRPAALQSSYSLLDREVEAEILPLCAEHGIEFEAYSPLTGGWLTGKYRRDRAPEAGSRMTMRPDPYLHLRDERVYAALDELAAVGARHGASMAAVALAIELGDDRDALARVFAP